MTFDPVMGTRLLEDGRELMLIRMMYGNTRLCIGPPGGCFEDGWCYHRTELAIAALETWDGQGNPHGFYKHLRTQRYQEEFSR
jgi:hypothetical protein